MIAVDHDDPGIAIRIDGVVGETDFIALASRVDDKVVVEVEEEAGGVLVVDFSSTVRFVLRDYLAAIFLRLEEIKIFSSFQKSMTYAYELILLSSIFQEDAITSDIARRHQQMLAKTSLDAHILARDLLQVELMSAALTQVGIALADSEVA